MMAKPFKKAFYLSSDSFFIRNSSTTNKPNPSKQHLFARFRLDKSYICNEKLRIIQLFEESGNSKEALKILENENAQ